MNCLRWKTVMHGVLTVHRIIPLLHGSFIHCLSSLWHSSNAKFSLFKLVLPFRPPGSYPYLPKGEQGIALVQRNDIQISITPVGRSPFLSNVIFNKTKKKTPWLPVRKRTIPRACHVSAKLVSPFAVGSMSRGQRNGSPQKLISVF
jgi:hypothetical protein